MHAPAGAKCRQGRSCCLLPCCCLSISFLLLQYRAAVLSLGVVSLQGALQGTRHCSRAAFAELWWEQWGERVDGQWAAGRFHAREQLQSTELQGAPFPLQAEAG